MDFWKKGIMLEDNNIKLRAIEPEDIDFIMNMENDACNWKVSRSHNPFSRFDIEQYVMSIDKDIYSAKQLRLIIERKDNDRMVGIVDIFDFNAHDRRAGIGIILKESARGIGIAGATLDILIDYVFSHLGLHQLFCNIGSDNDSSIRLFESRKFNRTGVKKDWKFINNSYEDELLYQLINQNN